MSVESEVELFVRLVSGVLFFKKTKTVTRSSVLDIFWGVTYASIIELNQQLILVSLVEQKFCVLDFAVMVVGQNNFIVFSLSLCLCVYVCVCVCFSCFFVFWYYLLENTFGKLWLYWKSRTSRKSSSFKFSHWNLNGLAAHDFIKIPLTEAFISTHNFDLLCLPEPFLDSTIDINDGNINISGYAVYRADHPSSSKRRGVCIYRRDDLSTMQKTIVTEISVENEACFLYVWSPSQNHDELDNL